ncbi:MAG TPA: hypothetical protein DDZ51_09500 [Planctomycetaceae bacterium]|nr:hypothetical protein [Planctomycetaceae bacterium]
MGVAELFELRDVMLLPVWAHSNIPLWFAVVAGPAMQGFDSASDEPLNGRVDQLMVAAELR